MIEESTALYRHYDWEGALLYVGISNDALRRLCQHSERAKWYRQVAKVEIQWLPSRREALEAEARAIRLENPVWNVRGKSTEKLSWYVFHPMSRLLDGWYSTEDMARRVRDYFAEAFPCEVFMLCSRKASEFFPIGRRWLAASNSESWAHSTPEELERWKKLLTYQHAVRVGMIKAAK